jgi:hypothetical protein
VEIATSQRPERSCIDHTRFDKQKVSSLQSADCLARRTHTSRRSRSPPPCWVSWRCMTSGHRSIRVRVLGDVSSRFPCRLVRTVVPSLLSFSSCLRLSFALGFFSFGAGFKVWIRSWLPLSFPGSRLGLCPDQGRSTFLWISSQADHLMELNPGGRRFCAPLHADLASFSLFYFIHPLFA